MASDEEIIRTMKVSMSMARDLGLEFQMGRNSGLHAVITKCCILLKAFAQSTDSLLDLAEFMMNRRMILEKNQNQ